MSERMPFNAGVILAGDIGGTKVKLGLFELRARKLQLAREAQFASRQYARLQDLVRDFLAGGKEQGIERACFGVAGPVRNGEVKLTNLPWRIQEEELTRELKVGKVSLINDLEANGYGLAELEPADFCTLNEGEGGARGNGAIISAGTGLGEAGLYWDGQRHHPFACEGGHADFAPTTALDAELFDYLRNRYGRVSCERLLSGSGLGLIYQFLRETKRGDEPPSLSDEMKQADPAAVIARAGMTGESSRCAQALDMFVRYFGAEAGNLGLKMMATGGVYVGGGIAPKVLPRIQLGGFMTAFVDKAPLTALLQTMPVRVVLNAGTALLGAAHCALHRDRTIAEPKVD